MPIEEIVTEKKIAAIKTIFGGLSYLLVLLTVAGVSARQGLSEYYVHYDLLDEAVAINAANPNAYTSRGLSFLGNENFQESGVSFSSAVALRPNDYLLWLRLGYCRYKLGDFDGARKAYERAIELAPNYAAPKRDMGRLLMSIGKVDEAFLQWSKAASINIDYLPEILDLARKNFGSDADAIEQAVRPESIDAKKQTAQYFLKYRMMSGGIRMFLTSDDLDKGSKNDFAEHLIRHQDFTLAHEIWKSAKKSDDRELELDGNLIDNGGFESEIDLQERNFGWLLDTKSENISYKLDAEGTLSSKIALRIEFDGNSDSARPFLSQLLLIRPNQDYQLLFATRSSDFVAGSLPIIEVKDVGAGNSLATGPLFNVGNSGWKKYELNFSTGNQAQAVIISLARPACQSRSCPAFGQLWLDDFQIVKR